MSHSAPTRAAAAARVVMTAARSALWYCDGYAFVDICCVNVVVVLRERFCSFSVALALRRYAFSGETG